MTANAQIEARVLEITRLASDSEQVISLRKHLEEVISGEAFKGSHRSQQFLAYIVERAIEGEFDGLKERVIGVELFQRSPSYDTSEDAIVRVTASDVRKRLLQHYGRYGTGAAYRISIPSGSYIPEIACSAVTPSLATKIELPRSPELIPSPHPPGDVVDPDKSPALPGRNRRTLTTVAILLALPFAFWAGYSIHRPSDPRPEPLVSPWSVFLRPGHRLQIVASDPDIATVQDVTGNAVPLSDYANGKYISDHSSLSPQVLDFCQRNLGGNKVADVDVPIVVNIVSLLRPTSERLVIRSARSMRLGEFHTDDDFILLGSPSSNPWWGLFDQQLDFRFSFDKASNQEIIRNFRLLGKELPIYKPTARGYGTGQSFAIAAFVPNAHQSGNILLIGGADAEGTEAAGRLVTRLPELSDAMRGCNIAPNGPPQHFEVLLQLTTMAGSPSGVDVIACHDLK